MTCHARRGWMAAGAALCLAGGAAAQVPAAPPSAKPKPVVAPDPAFEAAKAAFEALPEAERKGLQDALVWTGDYNSVITGTFGRRTYDAVLAYQKRAGSPAVGLPDAKARATILAAGDTARKAARFAVKPDPASGAVLGVPERLLPKRSAQPDGTRWQSADGRVTLDTKSFVPGETDLDALFARTTAPAADRKVTYKLKRPDFLVVTGETATGRYYIRYAAGTSGIRGFTIGYDTALAGEMDRLVIAVANSFVPFPEAGAAPAGTDAPKAAPGVAAMPASDPGGARPPAATGLVVGPGRVLTSAAAMEACANPTIGGGAARVLTSDPARNLALIEAARTPGAGPLPAVRSDPPGAGEGVVVFGADRNGSVSVAPAESAAGGERIVGPLQPGAAGAPVLDRGGALAGLIARFPASPRLVAGVAPPTGYALVSGRAVGAFLAENRIVSHAAVAGSPLAGSLGTVASTLAGAVVGIECRP